MRKANIFVIFFLFLAFATPSIGEIIFYDDCEDYPNLNSDWGLTENSGKFSVSSEKKRGGSFSYKMEFAPTEVNVGKRVELVLRKPPMQNWAFDKEFWLGYSIYIPSDFNLPTGFGVVGQWHKAGQDQDGDCDQAPRPPNPATAQPFMIFTDGTDAAPKMKVQITGQSQYCQPYSYTYRKSFFSQEFKKGAWNDVVIHTVFSYDKPGVTQIWLNGEKFIDIKEINAHNDSKAPYFKLGIYASSTKGHTVYYDEIRVGGSNSSYSEVAPKDDDHSEKDLDAPVLKIISMR
jgi:hypothetical protein